MSIGIYAIGFAILIGGLIYAAYLVHMPANWIVVGAVVGVVVAAFAPFYNVAMYRPAAQAAG